MSGAEKLVGMLKESIAEKYQAYLIECPYATMLAVTRTSRPERPP